MKANPRILHFPYTGTINSTTTASINLGPCWLISALFVLRAWSITGPSRMTAFLSRAAYDRNAQTDSSFGPDEMGLGLAVLSIVTAVGEASTHHLQPIGIYIPSRTVLSVMIREQDNAAVPYLDLFLRIVDG